MTPIDVGDVGFMKGSRRTDSSPERQFPPCSVRRELLQISLAIYVCLSCHCKRAAQVLWTGGLVPLLWATGLLVACALGWSCFSAPRLGRCRPNCQWRDSRTCSRLEEKPALRSKLPWPARISTNPPRFTSPTPASPPYPRPKRTTSR